MLKQNAQGTFGIATITLLAALSLVGCSSAMKSSFDGVRVSQKESNTCKTQLSKQYSYGNVDDAPEFLKVVMQAHHVESVTTDTASFKVKDQDGVARLDFKWDAGKEVFEVKREGKPNPRIPAAKSMERVLKGTDSQLTEEKSVARTSDGDELVVVRNQTGIMKIAKGKNFSCDFANNSSALCSCGQ